MFGLAIVLALVILSMVCCCLCAHLCTRSKRIPEGETPPSKTLTHTISAPTDFYHGTSLDAVLGIQREGFRVDLSGSNAGACLGDGMYVTTTLEKALNYAKPKEHAGAVLRLRVDLGKCYDVTHREDPYRKTWHEHGYDSAYARVGVIGEREENCVRDPARRVKIVDVLLGHTGEAKSAGYAVENGRLVRRRARRP